MQQKIRLIAFSDLQQKWRVFRLSDHACGRLWWAGAHVSGTFMSESRGILANKRARSVVVALACGAAAVAVAYSTFAGVAGVCRPGGPLAGSEFAHAVSLFVNLGRATLDAGPGVERAKLQITEYNTEWNSPITIFDGTAFEAIPHEYGENDFLIEYGGARICAFRHFRFSNWHVADYRFVCTADGPTVGCNVEILEGPGPARDGADAASCAQSAIRWGTEGGLGPVPGWRSTDLRR